jgi:copper transport protein
MPAIHAFDAESGAFVALRWLSYVVLVAGIGAVVMARITDRAATVGARHVVQTRLAAVGLAAAWLGIALALARLLAQSWAVHGADRAMSPSLLGSLVGSSTWGRAWSIQLLGAMLGAAGFTLALHDARRPTGWRLAGAAALVAALGAALDGHAAAAEGWRIPVLVVADVVHVLGAGAWIGGVMMLAVAVLPRAAAPAAANVVRAFSPWALSGVAALAMTGLVAAWLHLAEPLAPWSSRYGRTLLLKLALVAVVILIGALNWKRLGPVSSTVPGHTALRRSVWLEVLVALAVLAATAVLVAISPLD